MAEPERRVTVRKKRALKLGRKIVRVTVGQTKQVFAIHEEMLCANSSFFCERLQKTRKPIEGDCSICHDAMDLRGQEITFCKTCGGNLHYDCMRKWGEQQMTDSDNEDESTCPMCRSLWLTSDNQECVLPLHDGETFAVYSDWLYTQHIRLESSFTLLKPVASLAFAWQLGNRVGDSKFRNAIVRSFLEILEDTQELPGQKSIRTIYLRTTSACALRKLLVEVYVARAKPENFGRPDSVLCHAGFLTDFAVALLKKFGNGGALDWAALREKYAVVEEKAGD